MPTDVWRDLGPVPGACTVCGTDGGLAMGEVRPRPSLSERLRREHVAAPMRLVTCRGCDWRWTVRSGDSPSTAAVVVTRLAPGGGLARRPEDAAAPGPAEQPAPWPTSCPRPRWGGLAARTVLPAPRTRRRTARLP